MYYCRCVPQTVFGLCTGCYNTAAAWRVFGGTAHSEMPQQKPALTDADLYSDMIQVRLKGRGWMVLSHAAHARM